MNAITLKYPDSWLMPIATDAPHSIQNSLSDLVFVEEMSKFKSLGCWSFLELCDIVRSLGCR